MKPLNLLVIILLLISTVSFGQGIKNTTDTTINLPKNVAKATATDLVKGDSAIAELSLTKELLNEEKKKSEAKDKIILTKDLQISGLSEKEKEYQGIIRSTNLSVQIKDSQIADLNKQLKKAKRRKTRNDIFLSGAILSLGYLLISK